MNKTLRYLIIGLSLAAALFVACSGDDKTNPVGPVYVGPIAAGKPAENLQQFEGILADLRGKLNTPGISAAIVKNRKMVWAKGFGYANVEKKVTATPATCYHLASLTKTFASTIIMQLAEEGLLDLDDPVEKYGIELQSSGVVRVKHLFTHTSEGTPGAVFSYNGNRFGLLDQVIAGASGRTFCDLLVERIIKPLELNHTAPNLLASNNCLHTWPERVQFAEYLAQGYTSDGQNRQAYPDYFGVSAGLISSVEDVAKYSIAIDNNMFLREETKTLVFSPTISVNGQTLPYGLGWFVQNYRGVKLVWHYGYWTANSSLIIKVPERELAFVILANTDMLSRAFPMIGNGNISVSVVALEFLNAFVFGGAVLPDDAVVEF